MRVRPVARPWVLEKVTVGLKDLDLLLPFLETLDIAAYAAESRKKLFFLVPEDTLYCLKPGSLDDRLRPNLITEGRA